MIKFIKSLRFIFMPHYWLMNESYSEEWDKKLNELLDKYEFTEIERYTAKLGENKIWICNRPYATLTPRASGNADFRASRLTIQRGLRLLEKAEKRKKEEIFKDFK